MVRAWIISKSMNNPLARIASQEIVITRGGWDRTLVKPVVERGGDDFEQLCTWQKLCWMLYKGTREDIEEERKGNVDLQLE